MGEESRQLFGRRRRANVPGGRQHKHEVKVSADEESRLKELARAARVTVPALLIDAALSPRDGLTITERRQLGVEITELRWLMATVANNANQVAKFANTEGVVPEWIDQVVRDYYAIRPRLNAAVEELTP